MNVACIRYACFLKWFLHPARVISEPCLFCNCCKCTVTLKCRKYCNAETLKRWNALLKSFRHSSRIEMFLHTFIVFAVDRQKIIWRPPRWPTALSLLATPRWLSFSWDSTGKSSARKGVRKVGALRTTCAALLCREEVVLCRHACKYLHGPSLISSPLPHTCTRFSNSSSGSCYSCSSSSSSSFTCLWKL